MRDGNGSKKVSASGRHLACEMLLTRQDAPRRGEHVRFATTAFESAMIVHRVDDGSAWIRGRLDAQAFVDGRPVDLSVYLKETAGHPSNMSGVR